MYMYMYMCMYIYIYIYIYTYGASCGAGQEAARDLVVVMWSCICVHVCIYIYIYVYVCVDVYLYMYITVCTYVYIYIYIYICIWYDPRGVGAFGVEGPPLIDALRRMSAKKNLSEPPRVSQRLSLALIIRHFLLDGKLGEEVALEFERIMCTHLPQNRPLRWKSLGCYHVLCSRSLSLSIYIYIYTHIYFC